MDEDGKPSLSDRVRSWLADRADGVRALVAHLRQYVGRLRSEDGPTTRQSVLRSLGEDEPDSRPAAVGETCDRPWTDDSGLPWRTFHWYGGWGGHAHWGTDQDRYDSVARVVGLGGANDGTCGCPDCYEGEHVVGPDDAIRACRSVARQCRSESGHPLAVLANQPDTPGNVEYAMIRGRLDALYWCDRTSPYLDGAENVAVAATHMGLLKRRETIRTHVS